VILKNFQKISKIIQKKTLHRKKKRKKRKEKKRKSKKKIQLFWLKIATKFFVRGKKIKITGNLWANLVNNLHFLLTIAEAT
jgi:hypothetical protein